MLATVTIAGAGLLVLGPASPASADPLCQTGGVYVLWARGSGQGFNGDQAMAFQNHVEYALDAVGIPTPDYPDGVPEFWAELGNLDGNEIVDTTEPDREYPAVPVPWSVLTGAYTDSVTVGTDELVNHLNDRYAGDGPTGSGPCTNETVVLGGFSQGSDVIGWALERNGGGGYVALSQAAKDHIGFVALYGDPKYSVKCGVDRWWWRGNHMPPPACSPFGGMLGARDPYTPNDFLSRLGSWCDQDDGVCTGTNKTSIYGVPEGNHNSVYNGFWIWQSAAEIARVAKYQLQRLRQRSAVGRGSRGRCGLRQGGTVRPLGSAEHNLGDRHQGIRQPHRLHRHRSTTPREGRHV